VDYTTLSLDEVSAALQQVAHDAQAAFGQVGARELNWRPDETRWSVGQCFQHLLTANYLVLAAARDALTHPPASVWQRVPILPRLMGRALIRSQAPGSTGKYKAPANARPGASDIPADIIDRFVGQHGEIVAWMRTVDAGDAARAIMTSPFIRLVAYSVLDGCRLVVAHDHRHMAQARRVTLAPGFPSR
jgi:DinB family protein